MEENKAPSYPKAAGGLALLAWAVISTNLASSLYRWGAPLAACIAAIPSGILLALGLYRAGADEPGFYRALMYQALSLAVNQSRGYLGYEFYNAGMLLYGAAMLLSLRALNLACAAAARLLSAAGRENLAFWGGIVRKTNVICYLAALADLLFTPMLGMGFLLAAQLICIPLSILCLVFLFLAARALRAGRADPKTAI